jgi:hypothetical protein
MIEWFADYKDVIPDLCQLVRCLGIAEAGERLLCVVCEGVVGGGVWSPAWTVTA